LPTRSGREISLLDLATHRSGLPRMPEQMQMTEDGGASRFPLSQMYAFLSTTTLSYDIGERYYYSNLAFGLLGQALANRAGSEFETLLLERVCRPLGLTDTRVSLSGEQELRLAGTHNWHHGKTPPLEWDTMAAAGGVRSTAKDLLTFLAANMDLSSALGFPLQMSHLDRREASGSALRMGLGWHILSNHGRELIWHSGATFGNMTFAGFDKETRRGVVVLSNARGIIDDIGIHLLDPDSKLADFKEVVPLPAAVDVPFEKLERYAGEYELGPNSVLNIDAEDGKLYASLNEGLRTDLLAASETEVFSRMSPGVMEFDVDRAGEVDGLTVRVYGYEQEARKLEHYRRPPQRTQVASKGDLARFVGRYRFPDEQVAVVGLADSQLSVSVGGQLRMPLVPTKDGFFAQAAEAELMFVEDEAGHVTEVVVHQEGGHRAPRIGD
jgi:CubicO group peptidase (beta-lactamase class C family)